MPHKSTIFYSLLLIFIKKDGYNIKFFIFVATLKNNYV